ncbi:MAG TPA: sigma-70 family RNA polymerase sigma factor [Gemmataceae bacterium]|jgi:RNA polymerase sigma-70 factor (ECF subfamily)|nr:sigma-70 family RNA polymerase sigma factor [Gemmataceae bacterium]
MVELPTTRPSLLVRIRDARDNDAWQQFVQVYGPVVYGYGRKHGLQDSDAADLTQEVLQAVSTSIVRLDYDRRRGTFAGWLFTLAHHKLHDYLCRQSRPGRGSGDSGVQARLEQHPNRSEDRAVWDQEYERRLFHLAAEQVREHFHDSTWMAFYQTAVEGRRGAEVAAELGMTVAAVYLAKSRVMARLCECVQKVEKADDSFSEDAP